MRKLITLPEERRETGGYPRVPGSPRPRVPASPRLPVSALALLLALFCTINFTSWAQGERADQNGSHSSRLRETMSAEARETVERAIDIVCTERKTDPKGSIPIDDMQARPSLSVQDPAAVAGARRAQRLLPTARNLVISSLRQLAVEYNFQRNRIFASRLERAISRVQGVRRIRPDMDSRDNASVFLRSPHTITFGTIFLAGLPSDEGMISVLAHELVHIADGDEDSLRLLFRAIGNRASLLTKLRIRDQRAEELTCDLVGAMAAREYVSADPNYEELPRRIARAIEHNCVSEDEGDEDHLSPRNTIRALLSLQPNLTTELVYGLQEKVPVR